MDIWVIADNERLGGFVAGALRRQRVDCPQSRILSLKTLEFQRDRCCIISGLVFVVAEDLTPQHFTAIRVIKEAIRADAKLVVVSATADPTTTIKVMRCGCNDFLLANHTFDTELADFLHRAVSDELKDSKGRIIAIAPSQADTSADLLSVNLAATIASKSRSCGLIDLQLQGGDLALLLKLSPRYSFVDLLCQPGDIDDAMFQQALTNHESGIELLAAPQAALSLEGWNESDCYKLVELAQRRWSTTVINLNRVQNAEQSQLMSTETTFVLTMHPHVASLHRTHQHLEFLLSREIKPEQIHVLGIGTGYCGELSLATVKKLLPIPSVHYLPGDRSAEVMSINVGNPFVLELAKSKLTLAIKRFVESSLNYGSAASVEGNTKNMNAIKAAAILAMNSLSFSK